MQKINKNHLIYLFIVLALGVPLYFQFSVNPGTLKNSEVAFEVIEEAAKQQNKFAMLAFDFGPSTKAENLSQSSVLLEHILRRRIPVVLFTLNMQGEAYLKSLPVDIVKKLREINPGESWEYGKDWINIGLQVGQFLQSIGKTDDLANYLSKDVTGAAVKNYPTFSKLKTLKDVSILGEMAASPYIPSYIQFFRKDDYSPKFIHGPTSIMIPPAYNYLDSGQLAGLIEGVPGAAIYAQILEKKFPPKVNQTAGGKIKSKPHPAIVMNTALGIAQLLIIFFIIVGNIMDFKK